MQRTLVSILRFSSKGAVRASMVIGVVSSLVSPGFSPIDAQASASISQGAGQMLQGGDMVRLRIWREPDLSGDFLVNEKGSAVFPKIGAMQVGQLSPDSVHSLLVDAYSQFLQHPSIEITFLRRIQILGEVKNPGLYQVDGTMTLTDVLAMAGGMNDAADRKHVVLIREGKRQSVNLLASSRSNEVDLRSGDQLRVPQRSWLSRNAGVVAAGITGFAVIATALIRR